METQQVTSKNPKKVEAGKRLAEYNKKKREDLKKSKLETNEKDSKSDEKNNIGIDTKPLLIGLGVVGVIGIGYYFNDKYNNTKEKQKVAPRIQSTATEQTSKEISKFEME